jgi:hypothetical protein
MRHSSSRSTRSASSPKTATSPQPCTARRQSATTRTPALARRPPASVRQFDGLWARRHGWHHTQVSAVLASMKIMPWTVGSAIPTLWHHPGAGLPVNEIRLWHIFRDSNDVGGDAAQSCLDQGRDLPVFACARRCRCRLRPGLAGKHSSRGSPGAAGCGVQQQRRPTVAAESPVSTATPTTCCRQRCMRQNRRRQRA